MILAVKNAIYAIAYIEAWKIQDFNGVWTCDLTILVQCSNQLSYEATDVGNWKIRLQLIRIKCWLWVTADKKLI